MDARKKLVELLCNLPTPEFVIGTRRAGKKLITAGFIADHLIANGVTVQEWVSVKDRLPTEDEDSDHRIVGVVNGYNGKIKFTDAEIFVRYDRAENVWWSDDYDIDGCAVEKFYVVPQPQKGE